MRVHRLKGGAGRKGLQFLHFQSTLYFTFAFLSIILFLLGPGEAVLLLPCILFFILFLLGPGEAS